MTGANGRRANVDFDIIDKFAEGHRHARRLRHSNGGYECPHLDEQLSGLQLRIGTKDCVLQDELKPTDLAVVLFHDHGSRYVGKVYNDDWMREQVA